MRAFFGRRPGEEPIALKKKGRNRAFFPKERSKALIISRFFSLLRLIKASIYGFFLATALG
jgi:hypothetical protein